MRALTTLLLGAVLLAAPAQADPVRDIETEANLLNASTEVQIDGEEVEAATNPPAVSTASTPEVVVTTRIKCLSGSGDAVCENPQVCSTPPGSIRYDVFRQVGDGPALKVGETCLTNPPEDQAEPPQVTPEMVLAEFKAIAWPASPLEVQPPGGRTLVNLETNFFTTNTAPQVQPVQLLGQTVEIEATPTSWTWVHGDGTSQTTDEPGRAYPALDVTHTYLDADTTVAPRVDTTYAGRYRLDGGPWVTIPDTVTIQGQAAQLEVVPARPQLVGAG